MLSAVDSSGVITGFCFGAASTADQRMAETFFALRARPDRRLISVGTAASGPYITDKGFEGDENHLRWLESYGAHVTSIRPNATLASEAGANVSGDGSRASAR